MTKRLSPFSKEFWIEKKGFTESEANYKINSMRPVYKEYWLERGCSEKESIEMAEKTKKSNSRKGALKSASKTKEDHRKNSVRCVEFWISKGLTLEESKSKVKFIQGTNTLEKYIKKYGDEGFVKWVERNENWKEKTATKIKNEYKNSISFRHHESVDDFIKAVRHSRNMTIYKDLESFSDNLSEISKNNPHSHYMSFDKFVKTHVKKSQIEVFEHLGLNWISIVKSYLIGSVELKTYLEKRGRNQSWRMWVGDKLLRSSYEIYFYKKCIENNIIISGIDSKYDNSSMRYDFRIGDTYIEICPMIENNENYKIKMYKKANIFGSILLKNIKEIDEWIGKYDGS